jgi:hypothetical protein
MEMDKITAQGIFKSQILARWPDFDLSAALYDDWINFLSKYTPDDICRTASQYVLNYDAFKRPSLSKFRELINLITLKTAVLKSKVEKWPQYFLQQDNYKWWKPGYGTLIELGHLHDNPDIALNIAKTWQQQYQENFKITNKDKSYYYTAEWNLVVCKDLEERTVLIKDRSKKNRPDLLTKGNENDSTDTLSKELGKITDSICSKNICQTDEGKDAT